MVKNDTSSEDDNVVYKQILVINSDLDMGKGKIVGQACHGIVYYMEELLLFLEGKAPENKELYEKFLIWREEDKGLMKKIVLKAKEAEMAKMLCELAIREIEVFAVYDRGLTQVKENSFTCIVVEPLPESQCDELSRHLKLL
jgi:peptidyl-tRNA hydrolase, PTH2 family